MEKSIFEDESKIGLSNDFAGNKESKNIVIAINKLISLRKLEQITNISIHIKLQFSVFLNYCFSKI